MTYQMVQRKEFFTFFWYVTCYNKYQSHGSHTHLINYSFKIIFCFCGRHKSWIIYHKTRVLKYTGRKIGFTALLTRVKSQVKYAFGFDFTFDARQRCRQIYKLFAYSFDLGKGEVKLVTTLTSPLTRVKDEVKWINALLFL